VTGTATGTTGGTATGSLTGTTTGTIGGTTTGTPTGGWSYCDSVCNLLSQCGAPGSCSANCLGSAPSCQGIHEEWLSCLAQGLAPGLCDPPDECIDLTYAWQDCAVSEVGAGTCSIGDDGSCSCGAQLAGGFGWSYETFCQSSGGTSQCRCTVDGQEVGFCNDAVSPLDACSVRYGCCSTLFFVPFGYSVDY
jgi:hypothetical protein